MGLFDTLWDGARGAVSGAVDTVHSGYDALVANQREVSQGIHMAEGGISSLVHSGEDWVNQGSHALAARLGGGSIVNGLADAATFTSQVAGGVVNGASRMAGGALEAVEHPLDTASGIERMIEHTGYNPLAMTARGLHNAYDVATGHESLGQGLDHTFNPMTVMRDTAGFWGNMVAGERGADGERHGGMIDPYRQAIHDHRYGEVVGMLGADIGSMFIGGGEARAAGEAGEATRVLRAAEGGGDAARAMAAERTAAEGGLAGRGHMQMPAVDPQAIAAGRPPPGWGQQVRPLGGAPEGMGAGSTMAMGPSVPPARGMRPMEVWPEPQTIEQAAAENAAAHRDFGPGYVNRQAMAQIERQQAAAARAQEAGQAAQRAAAGTADTLPPNHLGFDKTQAR
jgi:hypothetical protein